MLTQFEMHSVEDRATQNGFTGFKNLTIIEDTLRLALEGRGESVDMRRIPLDDTPVLNCSKLATRPACSSWNPPDAALFERVEAIQH